MPLKRPAPDPRQRSGSPSESSSSLPPSKHARLSPSAKVMPDVKLYIVQAKIDPSALPELFRLAEQQSQRLCSDADEADVIITDIRMRRRLERHVPWMLAKEKAVVTPQWLRDSVQHGRVLPCVEYAAIQELRASTAAHCPDCNLSPCACSDSDSEAHSLPSRTVDVEHAGLRTPSEAPRPSSPGLTPSMELLVPPTSSVATKCGVHLAFSIGDKKFQRISEAAARVEAPTHLLAPDPPTPTPLEKLNHGSRYACQRASPLKCPNQDLVEELHILQRSRSMEGEERSALSYERAISIVKAYPHCITSLSQVQKLPFIGQKVGAMVEEFIDTGKIEEAQAILVSPRFKSLSLFTSIYGIGPNTARKLYNLGLRSIGDLEVYYGVEREPPHGQPELQEVGVRRRPRGGHWDGMERGWRERRPGYFGGEKGEGDEGLGDSWIRVALELMEDLAVKVPRDEVEEMGRVVMVELEKIAPGFVSTIVGGYRRGKLESNDVDIVFTHPNADVVKGMCKRLVHRLYERGMVSHVMYLSGFHAHNPMRTTHWDSLDKALTVFILPEWSPFHKGIRRRLDLIFALPEVYWTAVVGWTGSVMFQRDIRQWAKDKFAMKFDSSGITRRYDSKMIFPRTEKEVFDILGLEWVAPEWRNADA